MLTCNQERRDLVEDLLNAELLLRRDVLIHVCSDQETEQVLILCLLNRSPPTGRFLLQDCLLLLTHKLKTNSSHCLLGLSDRLGLLIHHLFGQCGNRVTGFSEMDYQNGKRKRNKRTIHRRIGIRPCKKLARLELFALLKICANAYPSSLESSPNLRASKE